MKNWAHCKLSSFFRFTKIVKMKEEEREERERLKQKDRTEAEDRGAQGERGGAAEGKEKVKEGVQWRRLGVGGRGTRRRRWRSWGNG